MSRLSQQIAGLSRLVNTALKFPWQQRRMFYKLLVSQLDAGLALPQALAALSAATGLPPGLRQTADTCREYTEHGHTFAEGMAASNTIPEQEILFAGAAEKHNMLSSMLKELITSKGREETVLSIFTANAYWLFILLLLSLLLYNGTPLVEAYAEINPAAQDLLVSRIISAVNENGLATAVLIASSVTLVTLGRTRLSRPSRKVLLVFATEFERACVIQFCNIAAMMLQRNVEHSELITIAQQAMKSDYAQSELAQVRERLTQGEDLASSLDGTLFDQSSAAILAKLVPGGDPALYPAAFETVAEMQRTQQHDFYTSSRRAVMLFSILTAAGGVLIIISGVLEMSALLQTAISQ